MLLKDELSKSMSLQRLFSEVTNAEKTSDKKIPHTSFYIIHLEIKGDAPLEDYTRSVLTDEENPCFISYLYDKEIYLFYSSIDGGEHYLEGSHQKICSKYVSDLSLRFNCPVNCNIIEIEGRGKVLSYFHVKSHKNLYNTISTLSNGIISKEETETLTMKELTKKLKKMNMDLEKIEGHKKYGSFFKIQDKNATKTSELVDIQDLEKNNLFFFN